MEHQKYDCNHVVTLLPDLDKNILQFDHFERKMQIPFVIYADFESLLIPIQTCSPSTETSFTHKTHIHEAYSFAYYIKCSYNDNLSKFQIYSGKDSTDKFTEYITADVTNIYNNHLKHIQPMNPLTQIEEQLYY